MTSEEIKQNVSMYDVLNRYNIRSYRGMAHCPWHGKDAHASMKIYKDGYHCFTCGANGDVFKFIQEYENVSFSEAFKILGGTYKHESERERKIRESELERARKKRDIAEKNARELETLISRTLSELRAVIRIYEPYSDEWVQAQHDLPYIESIYETKYIDRGEVNEINVIRTCRKIGRRIGIM